MAKGRWIGIVTGLLAVGLSVCAFSNRHAWHCFRLASLSGPLGERVYTDALGDPAQLDTQRKLLEDARAQIKSWLGELRATPRVAFCRDPASVQRFSARALRYSSTVRFPGITTLVFGPEGQEKPYVAHEYVHAELEARMGFRRIEWSIPAWFQEGLCMVISEDDRFPEAEWRDQQKRSGWTLGDLNTLRRFNRYARQDSFLAYGMAQAEVARWIRRVGKPGLTRLLKALESGQPFQQVYSDIEASAV